MKKAIMVLVCIIVLAVIFTIIPATLFAEPNFVVPPGEGHPAVPADSVENVSPNAINNMDTAFNNVWGANGVAYHVFLYRLGITAS